MTKINLYPTVAFSPYAKEHLQQLKFDEAPPPANFQASFEKRDLNWFGRSVAKIDAAAVNSLPIRIVRAVAILFLCISLIGISLFVLYIREEIKQQKTKKAMEKVVNELNMKILQVNKKALLVEKLAFKDFDTIPQLDLKGRMGATGYIDFLNPEEMSGPIMKGVDKFGRPFIALKMELTEKPFIVTLFQRYVGGERGDMWTWGTNLIDKRLESLQELLGNTIYKEETFIFLRKIISGEKVADFKLAS